jgi:hypothetical protein
MDPDEIESAYDELTALFRSSTPFATSEGWSAEMVGAHVAMNNDAIASVAESVARGESVRYDNAEGVDDDALRDFIDRVDGRLGVADEIERSARRLAAAQRSLSAEAALTEIPVLIHDNGVVVVDRPLVIGDFITGNATYHLATHLDQIRALT